MGYNKFVIEREAIMLEEIYELLGYKDIFSIKADEVKEYQVSKAHNHLMSVLLKCKELGIVDKVNEDRLDEIENYPGY